MDNCPAFFWHIAFICSLFFMSIHIKGEIYGMYPPDQSSNTPLWIIVEDECAYTYQGLLLNEQLLTRFQITKVPGGCRGDSVTNQNLPEPLKKEEQSGTMQRPRGRPSGMKGEWAHERERREARQAHYFRCNITSTSDVSLIMIHRSHARSLAIYRSQLLNLWSRHNAKLWSAPLLLLNRKTIKGTIRG